MDLLYNQQSRAISKDSPASFSWRAIASMYNDITNRSTDHRTIYSEFKRKYDKNKTAIDKVVANFDQDSVTLKTGDEKKSQKADTDQGKKTIDRMAKRASANLLKK